VRVQCALHGTLHAHTDNVNNDMQISIRYLILAKHWMWLPDDSFM